MKQQSLLITGATSGIGLALARQFSSAGHQVIITGRDGAKLEGVAHELGCRTFLADSADLAQLQRMAETLAGEGVRLDGLVLNAGVFHPRHFTDLSEADFDLTMAINAKGPLFTLQALLPCLANPSSVVFVSSIAVDRGFAGCSVYAASKAAAEAYIRVANMELAERGIRINSVRPGVTATEIQGKAGLSEARQAELFASLTTTPIGRVLTPDDQLGAIAFLLSDASLAMRNAIIEVDGGYLL
ncbi:SDR family oxidoreductase [Gallaecimonas sp. GXIMD4217]|uniref:SDR family oxidoreductase n=1 Tax=Gallaecimonas sp. GXIMD4217 TaxID=3131927 RepID=UPI00311AF127